ncbi:MAG: gamma-glutamylcyclotransferase [Pyrinomonadaceae bacterium]|nr:gamma-glutamylcyclotransferase [Pyrinomonadaceae bacterium]
MDFDIIIEKLNEKISSRDGFEKIDIEKLSETEQSFIEKYNPNNTLIIYGTLAPGRPNHFKIEHIKGVWKTGVLKGKLVNEGWGSDLGYFGFRHTKTDEQENIEAFVLFSNDLIDNWAYLDEFEGEGYRRLLAKYELDNGEIGIGNIYAINQAVD